MFIGKKSGEALEKHGLADTTCCVDEERKIEFGNQLDKGG
jgi:hypothetical protein